MVFDAQGVDARDVGTHAAPGARGMSAALPSSARGLRAQALRWRRRLIPDDRGFGWSPFLLLGYLAFLCVPFVFGWGEGRGSWAGVPRAQFLPTLASVALFLPLYFAAYRGTTVRMVACMLGIAAIGYALTPFNLFSNTYVIYAAGFAGVLQRALWQRLGWLVALLGVYAGVVAWLGHPMSVVVITALISTSVFVANHFQKENARKAGALRLSHDEVRRLAALAERERIGRDLHDLLGHTLSMVALKSDLAARLVDRDPAAARAEIAEVGRVARDALSQVRAAVSGMRQTGIAAELASARLLLESDGVRFHYALDPSIADTALPDATETALALVLREAVTNIQRHARADTVDVAFAREGDALVLRIRDDGRGGALVPGNGLSGMRERMDAIGGRLRVDAAPKGGTLVEARVEAAG